MTTRTYIGGPTLLVAADAITAIEFYNEQKDVPTCVYIETEEGFLQSVNPADVEGFRTELRRRIDEKQAPTEHAFVGGKRLFVRLSDIQGISIREDAGPDPGVCVHLRNGKFVSSQHPKDVSVFCRVAGRMPPDTARGHKEERE